MDEHANVSAWQLDQDSAAAYEQYLVARFFRRWAERLIKHAKVASGDRVLDAGCGTGIVARTAATHIPDARVIGVDLNEGMLAEARRQDTEQRARWEAGALESLPFAEGVFDIVLCQQALQFVPERTPVLEEMRRVLAPGGRVALAVLRDTRCNPGYEALAAVLDRHTGAMTGAMMRSPFAGPDADTIRDELAQAGFTAVAIHHDILDVRFPSAAEYLRQEAASSPLAGPLGGIANDRIQMLLADLEVALAPFTDDSGVIFPMETRFVLAYR